MRKVVVGVLVFGLSPAGNAEAITCKSLADVGVESMSDYFEELADPIEEGHAEKLLRKSVAAFHHEEYLPSMSLKEADELGEGVGMSHVKARNGKTYVSVNVGFGGGNSATYYYLPGTLSFVPVMSYDGDCVDQGSSEEFPIEKSIAVEKTAKLTCNFGEDSPFAEISIEIPLGANGLLFQSLATAIAAKAQAIVPNLEIETPRPQAVSIFFDARTKTVGFNLDAQARKEGTDWKVSVAARLKETGASVFGKAYPLVLGGYHSKQARDYKAIGMCGGTLGIEKVEYNRVVDF